MSDKLTVKQERFARNVAVKGMTQSDAYRDAYDCGKSGEDTIWAEASRVANDPMVSARIKHLQDKLVDKAIYTREKWAQEAEQIRCLALSGEKPDLPVALRAVREKADAAGLPTQKVDITSNGKEISNVASKIATRILGKR